MTVVHYRKKMQALVTIAVSVTLLVLYKVWKYYLREELGLDPRIDYVEYEFFSPLFRGLNTVAGIVLVAWWLPRPREQWRFSWNRSAGIMGIGLGLFLFTMCFSFGVPRATLGFFALELVVNGLTGFSEEFLVRGCLFLGLTCWMRLGPAMIVSSALFSLWHFDTISEPHAFVWLFFASLGYSLAFANGTSLLTLSVLHLLWDQIFFGVAWGTGNKELYDTLVYVIVIGKCLALWWFRLNPWRLPSMDQGKETVV